jgi:hypothetical protein
MTTTEQEVQDFQDLFKPAELHPDLVPYVHKDDGDSPFTFLKHPLIFQVPYLEQMNNWINLHYEQVKIRLARFEAAQDYEGVVFCHERAHRFEKLYEISPHLEEARFWKLFSSVWIDSENLWQFKHLIHILLRQENSHLMMDEEEQEAFAKLPTDITVYRGHQRPNKNGYSWTLDRDKATFFARRFRQPGAKVTKLTIPKAHAHALLLGRGEQEIIYNSACLPRR